VQANKVQRAIAKTCERLAATRSLLKGSVSKVILGEKTGPGQRVAYLLTYKGAGNKTQSVYVRKSQVLEVVKMIRNYQKGKQALERLVELNVKLFKTRQKMLKRQP
jgi:hypothetical protein